MIWVRDFRATDIDAVMGIQQHSVTASAWTREHYLMVTKRHDDMWIFDELHINKIAVTADERRKGIALALMDRCFDFAREHAVEMISLEVRESNHAAKALYEKWAFTEEGRRKAYYKDPEEDALVLKFSFPE